MTVAHLKHWFRRGAPTAAQAETHPAHHPGLSSRLLRDTRLVKTSPTSMGRPNRPTSDQQFSTDKTKGDLFMLVKSTLSAIAIGLAASAAQAEKLTSFDVAEDLTRFVWSAAPVFDDGMPAFGNAFITQGYIYEDGTLDGGAEGTLADGSPAFPEKVIGTWTCDGFFVGDGARTATGAMVITRQVFEFETGEVLINQGSELADINVKATRVITGGTGQFEGLSGKMTQTLLGMSEGYGVRLLIDLEPQDQAALGFGAN